MKTIAIPAELHASLKALADREGRKLRTLIERALRALVKGTKK